MSEPMMHSIEYMYTGLSSVKDTVGDYCRCRRPPVPDEATLALASLMWSEAEAEAQGLDCNKEFAAPAPNLSTRYGVTVSSRTRKPLRTAPGGTPTFPVEKMCACFVQCNSVRQICRWGQTCLPGWPGLQVQLTFHGTHCTQHAVMRG